MRVSRLPALADVPEIRRYAGCVSWVELDEDIDVGAALAVLDDRAFDARLDRLRSALGEASC